MAHAFWHVWGPQWPKPETPTPIPNYPSDQPAQITPIPNYPLGEPAVPTPLTQTSGTGSAYEPGFWERLGRSQMDPRTIKIMGDRQAAMVAEGEANEAARQENARNRMLAATRYIDPEMAMALKLDPTGKQGMVREQYAPPKEDDDWFKKMMQLSFMQSMMPERPEYTGTSTVRGIGDTGKDFVQWTPYTSPFPGGTV